MKTKEVKERELEAASQRMSVLLIELQMTYQSLGKILGRRGGDVIRNIIEKRNGISAGLASSICHIFPQIGYKWLFTGQGPMIIPAGEIPVRIESNEPEKTGSSQSEFIIELLKDKVKLLEEKVEEMKTIERLKRLGGSGVIPKTTTKTARTKPTG